MKHWSTVRCPRCNAAPGLRCHERGGPVAAHQERKDLARPRAPYVAPAMSSVELPVVFGLMAEAYRGLGRKGPRC